MLKVFTIKAGAMPNATFPQSALINLSIAACTFAHDGTGDITVATAHGLSVSQLVRFTTSAFGTLPPELSFNGRYFVLSSGLTTTKLRVSFSDGGAPILFA